MINPVRRVIIASGIMILLTGCQRSVVADPTISSGDSSSSLHEARSSFVAEKGTMSARSVRSSQSKSRTSVSRISKTSMLPRQSITLQSTAGKSSTIRMTVEIADDDAERQQGLMFRTALKTGMLFVYSTEQSMNFWMKNTLIPLDVIFFDDAGVFVSSQTMIPCVADPCATYPSGAPSRYALEVPAGYVAEHSIGDGWTLLLPKQSGSSVAKGPIARPAASDSSIRKGPIPSPREKAE